MTVVLQGRGNLALWPAPMVRWPEGSRGYAAGTSDVPRLTAGDFGGSRRFRFLVVVDSAGTLALPDLRYRYFDVGEGGWKEVTARAMVLPVLPPELRPIIVARRGQMLATAPLEREVAGMPTYAHYGYHYWRQLPDRRFVIGGWRDLDLVGETGYGLETNDKIQAAIEGGLKELVPEGAAIEYRWAGTMGSFLEISAVR